MIHTAYLRNWFFKLVHFISSWFLDFTSTNSRHLIFIRNRRMYFLTLGLIVSLHHYRWVPKIRSITYLPSPSEMTTRTSKKDSIRACPLYKDTVTWGAKQRETLYQYWVAELSVWLKFEGKGIHPPCYNNCTLPSPQTSPPAIMVSGYGAKGGRGRCYTLWQDFISCTTKHGTYGIGVCQNERDDYMECLHHKKLVSYQGIK